METKISMGRKIEDPEKTVFPALIFVSASHPKFDEYNHRGFSLALGWWDWSVQVTFLW